MAKEFWICIRCNYQEQVSQYKQSSTRFCPNCFKTSRTQIAMKKVSRQK